MKQRQKTNKQKKTSAWKYLTIILILITTMSTTTFTSSAHSPSIVTSSYNLQTQNLQVTITHQVADPTTHYIAKVEIKKNGATYNTSIYAEQPDPNTFTYSYTVNATIGDTIEVTASCIQGGSKTTQYTITQENTNNGKNDSSTPGFELFIFLGAVITIFLLLRKK
jgi:hypothetical protein